MIIFDLDGVLADNEHRKHFIHDSIDTCNYCFSALTIGNCELDYQCNQCLQFPALWKKYVQAYKDACDKDEPVVPNIEIFKIILSYFDFCEIWLSRSESVRVKTLNWIIDHFKAGLDEKKYFDSILKLRPIGDTTPDHELKERWLDEYIFGEKNIYPRLENAVPVNQINFVFDADPQSIEMWKRRGVFVFDVNQGN